MPLPPPSGRLTAEQVTYLPPGSEVPILHNASFALESGETLAIVGPSAAGKSTLARLIVGVLTSTPPLGKEDIIATITGLFLDGARARGPRPV